MNDRQWFTLLAVMAVIAVGAAGTAFIIKDAVGEPAVPPAAQTQPSPGLRGP